SHCGADRVRSASPCKNVIEAIGLIPAVRAFNYLGHEGLYYSLMMSTGLTFGTISALFGFNHGIIDQAQYSHLVATVIGSAVVPTAIANAFFMPRHLLPQPAQSVESPTGESVAPEVTVKEARST